MRISRVKYYDFDGACENSPFLARCSIVLDDEMILHDIKIFEGKSGRYIVMPERVSAKGSSKRNVNNMKEDVFHPVQRGYFSYLSEQILKGYGKLVETGNVMYYPADKKG